MNADRYHSYAKSLGGMKWDAGTREVIRCAVFARINHLRRMATLAFDAETRYRADWFSMNFDGRQARRILRKQIRMHGLAMACRDEVDRLREAMKWSGLQSELS
jgi:hypothetical protein